MAAKTWRSEFTFQAEIGQIAWAIVIALAGRLGLWILGVSLQHKELWYWIGVPVVYTAIAVLRGLTGGSRPVLRGEIGQVQVANVPPESKIQGAIIVVNAAITNLGEATVIDSWKLEVVLPDGQRIPTIPHELPTTLKMGERTIYARDALYDKVFEQTIDKGGKRAGALMFIAKDVKAEYLSVPGATYTLFFKDYQAREWTAEITWSPVGPEFAIYHMGSTGEPEPPGAPPLT